MIEGFSLLFLFQLSLKQKFKKIQRQINQKENLSQCLLFWFFRKIQVFFPFFHLVYQVGWEPNFPFSIFYVDKFNVISYQLKQCYYLPNNKYLLGPVFFILILLEENLVCQKRENNRMEHDSERNHHFYHKIIIIHSIATATTNFLKKQHQRQSRRKKITVVVCVVKQKPEYSTTTTDRIHI